MARVRPYPYSFLSGITILAAQISAGVRMIGRGADCHRHRVAQKWHGTWTVASVLEPCVIVAVYATNEPWVGRLIIWVGTSPGLSGHLNRSMTTSVRVPL